MKIHIRGGHVIDPGSEVDTVMDVYIDRGRIAALGEPPDGFTADRTLEAAGRLVCPGLVDLAARLRQPGHEHKATINSETRAAAAAGITTLCCPPDTEPVIDTPAVAELIHQTAEHGGKARVLPIGALTQGLEGEALSEMAALKQAGCVAVSNVLRPMKNTLVLRRSMEYAASHNMAVFLHAHDEILANGGCVHEGSMSTRLGLPGIPEAAETSAVASLLILIQQTGVRAHFCRLSSAKAVNMVGRASYEGVPVSFDVAAHHLFLTHHDLWQFNSQCHVLPPLRTDRDRDGLRGCLTRGALAAVCSDHQPHEPDAKLAPFPATEPGISALETLLPLCLRLVDEGVVTRNEAIACVTHRPASILGIDAGTLQPGARADVCIIDPQHEWLLDDDTLVSRGHNTPFLGWHLKGRVTHTLLGGKLVYELPAGDDRP
jgi:dihydroorotase